MTRSEPPADVIENVLRMLRESARWHDEENRPYSAGVERDAIALIESLRASSSLGGREGGVARPQTACAPQVLDIVSRPPAIIDDREARQKSVHEWCSAAFGANAASSIAQRGVRLLEEAVELYQAAGCERTMGHLLIDFVFDRPKGKLAKEIGQVGLVLLSMAEAAGVSADEEEVKEVFRVREKPLSHYAARNQAKNAAGFNTAGAELAGKEQVRGVSAEPQPPISESPAGALTAEKADVWRKKPVVVRAWQYDPAKLFPEWLQAAYANETVWFEGDSLAIKTLDSIAYASLGDWVMCGTQDELYPCKPDIFLATYEQGADVAAEEQGTRNRVALPPSSARERRMREILEAIHLRLAPQANRTFDELIRDAGIADDYARTALALSSDGRGREEK